MAAATAQEECPPPSQPRNVQRVQVYMRLCPSTCAASSVAVQPGACGQLTVERGSAGAAPLRYTFDGVYDSQASQADVFAGVASSLVDDVLAGYNASVLMYGQTGTGKTYTMTGPQSWEEAGEGGAEATPAELALRWSPRQASVGILPRALARVFEGLASASASSASPSEGSEGSAWEAHAAYVQVYREEVYDLLGGESHPRPLALREDPASGVFVEGLSWARVGSSGEALALAIAGSRARAVAATLLNAHSSRSHAIFFLRVLRRGSSTGAAPGSVRMGTLALVDLAGSERVGKSGVWGARFEEAASINLSLSALGNCVSALAAKSSAAAAAATPAALKAALARAAHVPYRDSKLTRLLQDSLGGNARTALIVTASSDPACASETACTCEFGARASRVRVQAAPNLAKDYRAMYLMLKRQMGELGGGGGGGLGGAQQQQQVAEALDGAGRSSSAREEELLGELQAAKARVAELEGTVREQRAAAEAAEAAAATAAASATSTAAAPPATTEGSGVPPALLALLSTPSSPPSDLAAALAQCWGREAAAIRLAVASECAAAVQAALHSRAGERARADAALAALDVARASLAESAAREKEGGVVAAELGARVEALLGEVKEAREEGEEAEVRARQAELGVEELRGRLREALMAGGQQQGGGGSTGSGGAAGTAGSGAATVVDLYEASLKALTARVEALEASSEAKDAAVAEALAGIRVAARGMGLQQGQVGQVGQGQALPPPAAASKARVAAVQQQQHGVQAQAQRQQLLQLPLQQRPSTSPVQPSGDLAGGGGKARLLRASLSLARTITLELQGEGVQQQAVAPAGSAGGGSTMGQSSAALAASNAARFGIAGAWGGKGRARSASAAK